MTGTVYTVNKGVNRPVEFRGLRGQYIWVLAGGVVVLLGMFAGMYIAGVNPFVCVGFAGIAGFVLFWQVYRFSRVYGVHGWMKRGAARRLPTRIKSHSRRAFLRR